LLTKAAKEINNSRFGVLCDFAALREKGFDLFDISTINGLNDTHGAQGCHTKERTTQKPCTKISQP
jgi:hypothetical protein